MENIHAGAAMLLGISVAPHPEQRAGIVEDLRDVPNFEDVAVGGDLNYAADIIANAVEKTAVHALDHIMRAHPGFGGGEKITMMAALVMFRTLSDSFAALAEAQAMPLALAMGDYIGSLPPEQREEWIKNNRARIVKNLAKVVGSEEAASGLVDALLKEGKG